MCKVLLTVTESRCRCGYLKPGDSFLVEDLCPPVCHELWNRVYPCVFALPNGAEPDLGDARVRAFDAQCPDEARVAIHGELAED